MNKKIQDLRENYSLTTLRRMDLNEDPIAQFKAWFVEAQNAELTEPNAMTLSTIGAEGRPSSRIVLLKEIVDDGLIFYTNYESKKALEMDHCPQVAINFLWKELQRQVRIEGKVIKTSRDKSLDYFQSRPKASQIGAWVSAQSAIIEDRNALESYQKELIEKYKNVDTLPLPPHWGGFHVQMDYCEFWQGRPSRLHDRFCYRKDKDQWNINRLAP